MKRNYWHDTDGTLDDVKRILGGEFVEWVLAQPHPDLLCSTRAAGAWTANEGESYFAFRSLEKLLDSRAVAPRELCNSEDCTQRRARHSMLCAYHRGEESANDLGLAARRGVL